MSKKYDAKAKIDYYWEEVKVEIRWFQEKIAGKHIFKIKEGGFR